MLVATASSDGKARVFSAWTKGCVRAAVHVCVVYIGLCHSLCVCCRDFSVDKRGAPCPVPDPEKKAELFGECLLEFECGGFVKDIAWSPSGNLLAFAAQDSSLTVADVTQGQVQQTCVACWCVRLC